MSPAARRLAFEDVVLFAAFLALPWAFGGVESWAWRPAAALVGVAAGFALLRRGADGLGLGRGAAWLIPAALAVGWTVLQAVPLPPSVVRSISPAAAATWRAASGDLEAEAIGKLPAGLPPLPSPAQVPFHVAGDAPGWPTLSLAPPLTREAAVWLTALLLALLLARRRSSDPEVGAVYRGAWLVLATALAAEGLIQAALAPDRLLGLRPTSVGRPFGPFVDGTNFTALMEIAVPWLVGYVALRWRRVGRADTRMVAALGAAALALVAGVAAQSRAGALLLFVGVALAGALVVRGARARWVILGTATAAGAAGLVALSPLGARFRAMVDLGVAFDPDRLAAWRGVASMIADHPVAGVGVGAFRHVFPRYLPRGEREAWLQAHNDWLEWVAVAGVVGAVLLVWFLVGLVREVASELRQPSRPGDRAALTGLAIGIGSVLVHALVEFNLQIPGVALPVAVAAGCVTARSRRTARGEP